MTIHENDMNNDNYSATYCPEDNKLRLYCGRVERDTFEALRAAGYKSTPKQDCDFVATWTPAREDIALAMIDADDDIGDEDYSPEERAADRAERFEGYREKRRAEAHGHADNFEAGPTAYGYQSAQKANRAARRHEKHRTRAFCQWSKAEYWQTRTAGVISNALHKSSASVRRGRILKIEKELRDVEKQIDTSKRRFAAWQKVLELEGADQLIEQNANGYGVTAETSPAGKLAYTLANDGTSHWRTEHPDKQDGDDGRDYTSAYDLLTPDGCRKSGNYADGNIVFYRQLTPAEVARLYIGERTEAVSEGSSLSRWAEHLKLRLAYENQMIGDEGGKVSEVDIIPGGFIGGHQIYKVHKSPTTKRVTSVSIRGKWGFTEINGRNVYVDHANAAGLAKVNIERLGEDAYRAPTAEELAEFKARTTKAKAAAKASRPKAPSIINPTDTDAEKLQSILNERRAGSRIDGEPREVVRMTQKVYSANSKGSYAACETEGITEQLEISKPGYFGGENQYGQIVVFKVRMHRGSVIILTDKPQKPLPFERCAEVCDSHPTLLELVYKLEQFASERAGLRDKADMSPEASKLFADLRYRGLGFSSTVYDWGLSKLGQKWLAVVKCLGGEMNYGHAYGLLDDEGNAKPELLEMAQQLEPGLIGLDVNGKLYSGAAVAAAR